MKLILLMLELCSNCEINSGSRSVHIPLHEVKKSFFRQQVYSRTRKRQLCVLTLLLLLMQPCYTFSRYDYFTQSLFI
uniref:Uncharacterized protein n=1 Tax=Anguilla anguilla TaxID=7936 RepID=A0A0E9US89_ANGAN